MGFWAQVGIFLHQGFDKFLGFRSDVYRVVYSLLVDLHLFTLTFSIFSITTLRWSP